MLKAKYDKSLSANYRPISTVRGYTLKETSLRENSARGYTLIEILITLTIIGFVFGTGYLSFRDFSRRQILTSAVRTMAGDLRLAQQQALAGKKPDSVSCNQPNMLESYSFEITGSMGYKINAVCSAGVINIKTVNFTDGVIITPPGTNPIEFKVVGDGTNLANTETITLEAFGSTRTLTVSPGGTVE